MNRNPVVTLCANCGAEIRQNDNLYEINEELWCQDCAADMYPAVNEDYDDE